MRDDPDHAARSTPRAARDTARAARTAPVAGPALLLALLLALPAGVLAQQGEAKGRDHPGAAGRDDGGPAHARSAEGSWWNPAASHYESLGWTHDREGPVVIVGDLELPTATRSGKPGRGNIPASAATSGSATSATSTSRGGIGGWRSRTSWTSWAASSWTASGTPSGCRTSTSRDATPRTAGAAPCSSVAPRDDRWLSSPTATATAGARP